METFLIVLKNINVSINVLTLAASTGAIQQRLCETKQTNIYCIKLSL